jgi:hypothetical protein
LRVASLTHFKVLEQSNSVAVGAVAPQGQRSPLLKHKPFTRRLLTLGQRWRYAQSATD